MEKINKNEISFVKNFNYYSEDRIVYDNEIKNFIPNEIIDFHIHLWGKEHIIKGVKEPQRYQTVFVDPKVIKEFKYQDFKKIIEIVFPGINYNGLFFGNPFKCINITENNEMIRKEIVYEKIKALFVIKPNNNYQFLERSILESGFLGFKPYPDLVINKNYGIDQDTVSIPDFLNEDALKLANKLNLIIMLHIPKKKRLADKKNIRDIINISKSYPHIKLVIAHAGRSYCVEDIILNIEKIASLENVYVDTTSINNWEVIEILLDKLGSERIIYGSDLPVTILRGKNICVNGLHYFFTSKPYSWSVSNKNLNEKDIKFFIYEEIREILKAIFKRKLDKKVINNIFFQNAKNLINDINIINN